MITLEGKEILIMRNGTFLKGSFALFDWLRTLKSKRIYVLTGDERLSAYIDKKERDIIEHDLDHEELERKIIFWSLSGKTLLKLSREEHDLFLKCCLVGKFYLSRQEYNIGNRRYHINDLCSLMLGEDELNSN